MERAASVAMDSLEKYRETILKENFDFAPTPVKWVPGENEFTLQRPEGVRTYYVYIPKGYNGTVPLALHISLHGLGDTCLNYGHAVGFAELADLYENFIYVYPCGYHGLLGNAWNAGTCCLSTFNIDDVQFMRDIVANAQSLWNINPDKIFASGFSNGAMMSEVLACQANDLFRAVASVSGCVELEPGNAKGLAVCDTDFKAANKNISVINIHGTLDPVVPYTGDPVLGFPAIPVDMQRWAERNGCANSTHQTLNTPPFTNAVYDGCPGDIHVELVTNAGGGHTWPQTSNFDTTNYIYNYFNTFQ